MAHMLPVWTIFTAGISGTAKPSSDFKAPTRQPKLRTGLTTKKLRGSQTTPSILSPPWVPHNLAFVRGPGLFWVFSGFFFDIFFGFMCVDVAKTARVTRMRLMPKLQSVFFGYFFGFCRHGSCRPCNRAHAFSYDPIASCALGFWGL